MTPIKRAAISCVLIAVLAPIAQTASAQEPASGAPSRIVTTTRLVAQFSGLEKQLTLATKQRDRAALDMFLSEDFEQWSPVPPGHPIPREDWLRNVLTAFRLDSFRIRQMAVRELGRWELVSFVMSREAICDGRDCSGDVFVVDLWQQRDRGPRLLERYESPVENLRQSVHVSPPRPIGKE